jgi:hypothetical protein
MRMWQSGCSCSGNSCSSVRVHSARVEQMSSCFHGTALHWVMDLHCRIKALEQAGCIGLLEAVHGAECRRLRRVWYHTVKEYALAAAAFSLSGTQGERTTPTNHAWIKKRTLCSAVLCGSEQCMDT